MLDITGIDHVAINAINYEKTIHFYRDILEFKELNSVKTPELTATYLQVPGGSRLEIFDNKGKTKDIELDELNVGMRHMAFTVNDVKKHEEVLVDKGVEMLWETTELPDFNARVILFYDPNGIVVELCESLK